MPQSSLLVLYYSVTCTVVVWWISRDYSDQPPLPESTPMPLSSLFPKLLFPSSWNRVDKVVSAIFLSCARCDVILTNYCKVISRGTGNWAWLADSWAKWFFVKAGWEVWKKKKNREEAVRLVCDSPDVFSVWGWSMTFWEPCPPTAIQQYFPQIIISHCVCLSFTHKNTGS